MPMHMYAIHMPVGNMSEMKLAPKNEARDEDEVRSRRSLRHTRRCRCIGMCVYRHICIGARGIGACI